MTSPSTTSVGPHISVPRSSLAPGIMGQPFRGDTPTIPPTKPRVRVPSSVRISRIPAHVRRQLSKSQVNVPTWQSKQICDHFISGTCPYVPCRYAHQCMLCMDDLVGACKIAMCKYVHLLRTPDPACADSDNEVIFVHRGQLLPPGVQPETLTPSPDRSPVMSCPPPPAFPMPESATALQAVETLSSATEDTFSHGIQSYPAVMGYGGLSPQTKLGPAEFQGAVRHGCFPTSTETHQSQFHQHTFPQAPSSSQAGFSEYQTGFPATVASGCTLPCCMPSSQHHPATMAIQHVRSPVTPTCQLPCCAMGHGQRGAYNGVPPAQANVHPHAATHPAYTFAAPPPPQLSCLPAAQPPSSGTFQHSPYSIQPSANNNNNAPIPTSSSSCYPYPAAYRPPCACPSCAISGYDNYYASNSHSDHPPSPSASSAFSDSSTSSNPWRFQRTPPAPSPRPHKARGTYDTQPFLSV